MKFWGHVTFMCVCDSLWMILACCHVKWTIVFSLGQKGESKARLRRGNQSRKKEKLHWRTENIKSTMVHTEATGRYKGECSLHRNDWAVLSGHITCGPVWTIWLKIASNTVIFLGQILKLCKVYSCKNPTYRWSITTTQMVEALLKLKELMW